MSKLIPLADGWRGAVIATRTLSGRSYYLVDVSCRTCPQCIYGRYWLTTWCSEWGKTERICWCSSCFDGAVEPAEPTAELIHASEAVLSRARSQGTLRYWNAVRPAIMDLQQRGML